jgi:hypothetical protein
VFVIFVLTVLLSFNPCVLCWCFSTSLLYGHCKTGWFLPVGVWGCVWGGGGFRAASVGSYVGGVHFVGANNHLYYQMYGTTSVK